MEIQFYKYQATGNDFVVIDGRNYKYPTSADELTKMCHRRFGIGADGVLIIKDHSEYDFELLYYNPDGTCSFCGNGARSAVSFANFLGLVSNGSTRFLAFDGPHEADIDSNGLVRLKMGDVQSVRFLEDGIFLDTGSPHMVRFVEKLEEENVMEVGRRLRYDAPIEGGTNVNFVQIASNSLLKIRTYERGVENETFSCGTGVTASAIAASYENENTISPVTIKTQGGELKVEFTKIGKTRFENIYLTGPAHCAFSGLYKFENI